MWVASPPWTTVSRLTLPCLVVLLLADRVCRIFCHDHQRAAAMEHIALEDLKIGGKLAEGVAGEVRETAWDGATVVSKLAKPLSRMGKKEVQMEVHVLGTLPVHHNFMKPLALVVDAAGEIIGFVMRRCLKTLDEFVYYLQSDGGELPTVQLCTVGAELAGAMAFLHQQGWLHRDLKGLNIVLGADGRWKVIDMGVCLRLTSGVATLTSINGTLGFFAPEARVLGGQVTNKADVYSFGVVLWTMVTRAQPTADMMAGGRPQVPNFCPQRLAQLIELCTQLDPNLRPDATFCQRELLAIAQDAMAPTPTVCKQVPVPTVAMQAVLKALSSAKGSDLATATPPALTSPPAPAPPIATASPAAPAADNVRAVSGLGWSGATATTPTAHPLSKMGERELLAIVKNAEVPPHMVCEQVPVPSAAMQAVLTALSSAKASGLATAIPPTLTSAPPPAPPMAAALPAAPAASNVDAVSGRALMTGAARKASSYNPAAAKRSTAGMAPSKRVIPYVTRPKQARPPPPPSTSMLRVAGLRVVEPVPAARVLSTATQPAGRAGPPDSPGAVAAARCTKQRSKASRRRTARAGHQRPHKAAGTAAYGSASSLPAHIPRVLRSTLVLNEKNMLSEGAAGVVHATTLDCKQVAVKMAKELSGGHYDQMVNEVTLLAQLPRHMNIIAMEGVVVDGMGYILGFIMPLCPHSLEKIILQARKEGKLLHVSVLCWLFAQICQGLDKMQKSGVLHRDIKCGNILIKPDGCPTVCDFGLSVRTHDGHVVLEEVCGTCGYLAPEAAYPGSKVSSKADVYSFGAVMWAMTELDSPGKVCSSGQPLACSYRCHPKLAQLIQLCLSENPDLRPSFAQLARCLWSLGLEHVPPPPPARTVTTTDVQAQAVAFGHTPACAGIHAVLGMLGAGKRSCAHQAALNRAKELAGVPLTLAELEGELSGGSSSAGSSAASSIHASSVSSYGRRSKPVSMSGMQWVMHCLHNPASSAVH